MLQHRPALRHKTCRRTCAHLRSPWQPHHACAVGVHSASCGVQERRKHEEERSSLTSRLALADAVAQQLPGLQAELTTARDQCAALKARPASPRREHATLGRPARRAECGMSVQASVEELEAAADAQRSAEMTARAQAADDRRVAARRFQEVHSPLSAAHARVCSMITTQAFRALRSAMC